MEFDFDIGTPINAGEDADKIDRRDDSPFGQGGKPTIRIDYDLCEDSGTCYQVCPEDVIEMRGHATVAAAEKCTECWLCVENCASGAIEIT